MSGQSGSIGSIILGVVIGVVAVASQQYYLLFTAAALIAGGALGLSYRPKAENQNMAGAQDLKIATAVTGMPLPVVFGTARVTPNFQRSNKNLFSAVEIKAKSHGGKGGDEPEAQVVGYNYFHKFEMDVCMGSIDSVGQVYSMPGEVPMIDAVDPWVEFGASDYVELTLTPGASDDENDDDDNPEGGLVRLYRGAANQVRVATGDAYQPTGIPYKNICWALFGIGTGNRGFCLGSQPQVRTYQFMVRRLCRCVRDDGSTVVGLKVRGSDDINNPSYHLANPAAIYYEALTNKVWGRGLSSGIIDEASFISTSNYYAEKNIGLGLALEQADDIGSFLEGVQRHCKTLLTWDGEVYKLKSLLNVDDTHGSIVTLRDTDLKNFVIGVPLWESTVNELRAEFNSSERGERPDSVTAQDLGNVDILGGRIIPQRIQLPGFNSWNIAYQQVARILAELSYPWRTGQWEMNRFQSHIAVGEVVRIVSNEFTTNKVTSYWLIVDIKDGSSDDESLQVSAVEDQVLSPIEGEESDPIVPATHPWERIVPVDPDDIYLTDEEIEEVLASGFAFEAPEIINGSGRALVLLGLGKMKSGQRGAAVFRSLDDVEYSFVSRKGVLCITGTLVDAMPAGQHWDRSATGFRFDVENDELALQDLAAVNIIDSDTDHLERLAFTQQHWIICEEELMQVGLIENVSGAQYRMRNLIRGKKGTRIRTHGVGAKVFYLKTISLTDFNVFSYIGSEYFFRLRPYDRAGYFAEAQPAQIFHYGANNGLLLGITLRPLSPESVSITDGGSSVTLKVRPRSTLDGPDINPFVQCSRSPIRSLGNLTFAVMQIDAGGNLLSEEPVPIDVTYTAPTLTFPGEVSMVVTKLSGATAFRVYQVEGTMPSYDYAEFSL